MLPTTEELRQQCRIDHTEDDKLLTLYLNAAKETVENHLNRQIYSDAVPENISNGVVITSSIKLALMLLVGHFYENREATSTVDIKEVPIAFRYLLAPYRIINV